MESLPQGTDNADTQIPISPTNYEATSSMVSMLEEEDKRVAAAKEHVCACQYVWQNMRLHGISNYITIRAC